MLTTGCSSTGVQIGGVGSAMGLAGVWTTAVHDIGALIRAKHSTRAADPDLRWKGDPVGKTLSSILSLPSGLTFGLGPFWMWKNDSRHIPRPMELD